MLYLRMQQSSRMALSMAASQSESQATWALVRDLFASHTVDAYKPPGWTGSCAAPRMVDCPAGWGLPTSVVESCIEFCRKVVDVDSNIGYRELITVGQGCGEDWWDAAIGARVGGLNLKTVGSGTGCAGSCNGNKQRSDIRVERAVFKCGSGAADKVAKTFLFPDQSSIQAAMGGAGAPMNACLSGVLSADGGTTNKISVQTVFGYAGQLAASKAANIGPPFMDLESVLNQQTLEFQADAAKHMQEVAPGESVQKMYGVAATDISNCPFVLPKPCWNTTLAAVPTKLDFESIPNPSQGLVIDNVLNDYLSGAYGIRFVAITGGNLQLAAIKNQNDTDATFHAWMSALCTGLPKYNRLCRGGDGGQWILSVATSMTSKSIEFDAVYDSPADRVEFDLADLDGGESWTITPYNAAGAVIPGAMTFNAANGYGGDTGNNKLTHLTITTSDTNISRIKFKGIKGAPPLGLGFDNFTTGISYCPK